MIAVHICYVRGAKGDGQSRTADASEADLSIYQQLININRAPLIAHYAPFSGHRASIGGPSFPIQFVGKVPFAAHDLACRQMLADRDCKPRTVTFPASYMLCKGSPRLALHLQAQDIGRGGS